MNDLLGTTVSDLLATMKERRVRMPSEIGAFVALEVAESVLSGPASVDSESVRVADDGTVSVFAPPNSATSEEAARSIVALLASLLLAAGTGVPRALVGLLEEGPSAGHWDLHALRDDLEASLVPLNRAAARRVLARMIRETRRPASLRPGPVPDAPPPRDESLDADLDALIGVGDGGAPAAAATPPTDDATLDTGFDDLDATLDATLSELSEPVVAHSDYPRAREDEPTQDATLQDAPAPRAVGAAPPPRTARPEPDDALAAFEEATAPRRSGAVGYALAFVALLAATAAAIALMRPDLVDAALGRPPAPPPPEGPTAEDQERILREHRARFGQLTIDVAPARTQVLLYVGRGPTVARELPVGVAHELLAIAEGRRPSRTVLPPDAEWERTDDGLRYELALQAGDEPMDEAALDLGETRLPRDVGQPTGELGSVRVITNPPGAKVYVLIGFTPGVVVENVRTDEAAELLFFHPEHGARRAVVGPSDWQPAEDGSRRATIRLDLVPSE